uniref:Phosphatidylinositol N-acetylglucosaminyltransferase subunit C n=1 Tax=Tetradesmus obliquus TaxID=3088 RepID=A0A383WEY0_TETOB|eukprot:jgi/Sobl393_1/9237/SZX75803.1
MNGINSNEKHSKVQTTENAKPPVTLRFRAASAAVSTAATAVEQEQQPNTGALPPWEKVLWRKQPYPDNYVDDSFLQHMVVNADVPQRDFWQVALGSAAVSQQLATVVAAVSVPVHLRLGLLQGGSLLLLNVALLLLGYAVCGLLGGHVLGGSLRRGVRQVVLLSGGVYLLSPMLHSLTRNVSEDSVIAMIVGLCVTHLALHDYNFVNSVTEQLTGTVSLGAAVFASVLFASGMPTELDVFVHVLFCLQLYLLSPLMRRYIRNASLTAHVLLTAAMTAAAVLLLLPLSRLLTAAYVAVVLSVSFVCPYWLVHIQKFKAKINGPWDEAVPKIPTSIASTHSSSSARPVAGSSDGGNGG